MPSLIPLTHLTLILLSIAGYYLTWHLFLGNGSAARVAHLRDIGPHLLPGTNIPFRQTYTGIGAIDYQLTSLGVFFWQVLDGSMPHASLSWFRFLGQIATIWGLSVIEAMRAGNKSKYHLSLLVIWGLLVQNVGYAVIWPLFLALHLATSPTTRPTPSNISTNIFSLLSVPFSITLGFILPSIATGLPAPSIQSFASKQIWIAIWQFFPIWVSLFQQIIPRLIFMSFPSLTSTSTSSSTSTSTSTPSNPLLLPTLRLTYTIPTLRLTYTILLLPSLLTRTAAFTLTSLSLLSPPNPFAIFHPLKVDIPIAITRATHMPNLGSGAHLLLQYDEVVGSAAVVLWALTLLSRVGNGKVEVRAGQVVGMGMGVVALGLVGLLAMWVLAGAAGCAVGMFWVRDEIVLRGGEGRGSGEGGGQIVDDEKNKRVLGDGDVL